MRRWLRRLLEPETQINIATAVIVACAVVHLVVLVLFAKLVWRIFTR